MQGVEIERKIRKLEEENAELRRRVVALEQGAPAPAPAKHKPAAKKKK